MKRRISRIRERKQARAARSLTPGYRIALTGTPVENNVGDLWSLMEFLESWLPWLAKRVSHAILFTDPGVWRLSRRLSRLRKITGPFILRRLKTDKSIIADLPDKLEMKVFCNLTKEQASLYEAVVKGRAGSDRISGRHRAQGIGLGDADEAEAGLQSSGAIPERQSRLEGRSGKLARSERCSKKRWRRGRSLIFTQFREMGDILQRHLQETFGRRSVVSARRHFEKQRDIMVERFAAGQTGRAFSCCR